MPETKRHLKVFLCHASQDKLAVRELYSALKNEGWIDPWLDKARILPGQDWRIIIEKAVEESDVVIVCLSTQSVSKEGFVQREIKYAYDIALEKPEETIFLIPLRLDDCAVPRGLRSFQWVDYFGAEKAEAYSDLLDALKLRREQKSRLEAVEGEVAARAAKEWAEGESADAVFSPEKQVLRILVTGGRETSRIVENLAFRIGYQVIMRGHIMLNHGTRGVDKAAAEGALKACGEKSYPPENLIYVYRPEKGSIPDFGFGKLQTIGRTFHERRNYVIDQSHAVIILGGGRGTRDTAQQVKVAKKPLIPIGVGDPKEAAVDIWQRMLISADTEDTPIGRHDLKKIGNLVNHEKLAVNAVILAEILARKSGA